ncbi:FG-GAP repeat domain-containing protein [Flagellimonas lutaonensis]|uniref:Cytochrome c domain-containing protein n=1 Tax=Flagellimonas lutaonensis TaxID=516051 RepID=A0A0D5YWW6_9FLAO|nr:VCBS repeat-containing protein [Allomuricauda lutaonensis]AKA36348.1 hypothetical protein VC82_2796 [Allomuricauda lutaonensis]
MKKVVFKIVLMALLCFLGCKKKEAPVAAEALYNNYCAACHALPRIDRLPKHIWKYFVLPDMAARMKITEQYQDPFQEATLRPEIALKDWVRLENYIVSLAPEKLPATPLPKAEALQQFTEKPLSLDDQNGSLITYFQMERDHLFVGNYNGEVYNYMLSERQRKPIVKAKTPVTWFSTVGSWAFVTEVGLLDPSEQAEGSITVLGQKDTVRIPVKLHRPVHTLATDLNGDGTIELVVSEFGDQTGRLSLLTQNGDATYRQKTLLNQPGCIRTLAKDMNDDGKLDLVVLTSQGNEGITVLYQKNDLAFRAERVLEFSPVFGSSWFEMLDYNGDGHTDIVTVNGDNADKSYVHKPYHGLRIHLNDGQHNFEEVFFYPLNGATRFVAEDFDQDGDIDFGVISTFPDYERAPRRSFVYLENKNAETFTFSTKVLKDPFAGRWFLMDAGDVDNDGDLDMVLTSFTYSFMAVPKNLSDRWADENVDVLLLENTLK